MEHDLARVRGVDAGDVCRHLVLRPVHALDRAVVVEAVLRDQRLRLDAPEGVLDVLRRHVAIDRGSELDPGLQIERVRQLIGRDLGRRRRDVRDERVARQADDVLVGHQCPQQQVAVQTPRRAQILTGRIERAGETEVLDRRAVHAALGAAGGGAGRTGAGALVAATRSAHDGEYRRECENSQDSLLRHAIPFPSVTPSVRLCAVPRPPFVRLPSCPRIEGVT